MRDCPRRCGRRTKRLGICPTCSREVERVVNERVATRAPNSTITADDYEENVQRTLRARVG